jgi:hypothetical protein
MSKLISFEETAIHKHLAKLFSEIDKDAIVKVTHGTKEFGADLVVIRKDRIRESIASVVVSIGNLRGETGGQIERIVSQIKQSFDIPKEVSTRLAPTSTTEVWLVLVGEIGENARKRLDGQVKQEYKSVLTILDIEWLIERFTSDYPEVFLGGEILDFIEKRIESIESTVSLSKRAHDLNLSEWYVEPFLSAGGIPIEVDDAGTKINITSHRVQFKKLAQLLGANKRIIVAGDAGVGKTTALQKLVLDMLRDISNTVVGGRSTGIVQLPVFMLARDILDCDNCHSFSEKCIEKGQLTKDFTIGTLILDGLDEVSAERRNEVLQKAVKICGEGKWDLLVGSRKIDVVRNPPKGITTYELLPFEVNQALKLFEKIVKEGALLVALKEGLSKVLTQLPMTPISLTILIEIAEEHGEVPASLADLYNRYFEVVLGKWDFKDKGIELLFQYEIKLHFLAEIAWTEFTSKDRVEITRQEFNKFVQSYIGKFGFEQSWMGKFILEIERAGLIELKEMVSFRHRSFLDYFAALYIYSHREEFGDTAKLITKLYFSDFWGDVSFYFVGIQRSMADDILNNIMDFEANGFEIEINKFAIGRLMQAGWLSPIDIKCDGLRRALSYLAPIRERLSETFSKTRPSPGMIFADFIPVMMAEWTMGSITLVGALQRIHTELIKENNPESLWKQVGILWSLWRFLSETEQQKYASELLDNVSNCDNLSMDEKSSILLLMMTLSDKTKNIRRSVDRRLKKIILKHPQTIKRLLPPRKEGFRMTRQK